MTGHRKEYVKVYRLGHNENRDILGAGNHLVITEKVDGSNFRFWSEPGEGNDEIHVGSHHVVLGTLDDIPAKSLFRGVAEYIVNGIDPNLLNPDYTYFGEMMMVKHTLKYTGAEPFLGFDIWVDTTAPDWEDNEPRGRYLTYTIAQRLFADLGLMVIPPIYDGKDTWNPDTLLELLGQSLFDPKVPMEGVVIKAYDFYNKYGRQVFAKIVREEFREVAKAVFQKPSGPEEKLVATFCTPARVGKAAQRLVLAGEPLDMPMMKHLPKMVFEDIMEEEWREIVYIRQSIDFGLMRNRIAKRCARLLANMIMEGAT